MAKVDIYHYGSATDVDTVTLSNCDSTNTADYAVWINQEQDSLPGTYVIKPHAISGSTMTLKSGGAITKCHLITVIQKGA